MAEYKDMNNKRMRSENDLNEDKFGFNDDNTFKCNPKFNGLIEGPLSGSSHDRVVHSLVEMFDHSPEIRHGAFDKIKSTGRLALPTLYGILLDENVLTYICGKTLGFKRKEIPEKIKDNEIRDKMESRKVILKMDAVLLVSKIVVGLDYEEKNRAASVFQYLLTHEKNSEVIYSVILSSERLGDAGLILLPTINEIAKNSKNSQKIRNQAISFIAKASEYSKNSINVLINILKDKNESLDIKKNAVMSLEEYADSVNKEKIEELFTIILSELEANDDFEFTNKCISLLSACKSKILEYLIPLIKDRNRSVRIRECACFACFGVAKKDFNLEDYVLSSFHEIIDELKPDIYYLSVTDDDVKIYNLLVDLAKKLSY
ncbi:MAG: hypothetical protein N3G74_01610 [Candidatus Micrarchaeota archaeon]|nr:hypothetical protein [Candidatus Micrarchaeota archaeon]